MYIPSKKVEKLLFSKVHRVVDDNLIPTEFILFIKPPVKL